MDTLFSVENYVPGDPYAGYKLPILLSILKQAAALGEKLICFSQSLGTLDLIDKFIKEDPQLPGWEKHIWRIDGKSNSFDREKTIKVQIKNYLKNSIKFYQAEIGSKITIVVCSRNMASMTK